MPWKAVEQELARLGEKIARLQANPEHDAHIASQLTEIADSVERVTHALPSLSEPNSRINYTKEMFQADHERLRDGAFLADLETMKIIAANPAGCEMFGYSIEEISKLSAPDLHPPSQAEEIGRSFKDFLQGFSKITDGVTCTHRDGTNFFVTIASEPVTHAGRPAVIGVFHDITPQRKSWIALVEKHRKLIATMHDRTEELREHETLFKTLTETIPAATFIFQGPQILYASPAAENVSGYSLDELLNMKFWEVIHPDHRDIVRERGTARQSGEAVPQRYEVKLLTKGGDVRWVDFTAGTIEHSGKPAVIGTAFDITERKKAEQALKQSEKTARAILDASADATFLLDTSGKILALNEVAAEMLRSPPDALVGLDLCSMIPEAVRKNRRAKVMEVVKTGRPTIFDDRIDKTHFEHHLSPIFGSDSTVEQIAVFIRDTTLRHLAEQRSLEHLTQLARVARLSTMGEMAASLAHELNQPLHAVVNFTRGCVLRLQQPATDREALLGAMTQAAEQAQRAGEIVRRLRSFVRRREPQRARAYVNTLIREVVELVLVEAVRFGFSIDLDLADDLPTVNVDSIQIQQVVLNLLRNSIEALKECDPSDKVIHIRTDLYRPNAIEVMVIDNGPGIPKEVVKSLFDPFITTKPEGTGLGLSIAKSIIESHGGQLTYSTGPHKGATFTFILPCDS